jgi:hypothetical protein
MAEASAERKVPEHFRVEEEQHGLYKQWADPAVKEEATFPGMPSMFMYAAALGHALHLAREMRNPKVPVFRWTALAQDSDIPVLEAIAVQESKDLTVMDRPDEVMEIAQRCATGGVDHLRTILTGSRERNLQALAKAALEFSGGGAPEAE